MTVQTSDRAAQADGRLHRRRRRACGLRCRRASCAILTGIVGRADRSGAGQGLASLRRSARDRRAGPVPLAAELRLRNHAAGGVRRTQGLPAARPRARRIEPDQRHDLYARPAAGLRVLGCARLQGLGLAGRAALFQARRGQRARGRRVAWRRRAPACQRPRPSQSRGRGFRRGRGRGRLCAQRRLQRSGPGRRRRLSTVPEERPPLQRRPRVSAGLAGGEPGCLCRLPGAARPVRGEARRRRRLPARRTRDAALRPARGDPFGRRLWFAAASDGVGRRPGRGAEAFRHRGGAGRPRCRDQPAGPLRLCRQPDRQRSRPVRPRLADAHHWARRDRQFPPPRKRPPDVQRSGGGRLREEPPGQSTGPTCSSISALASSTTTIASSTSPPACRCMSAA